MAKPRKRPLKLRTPNERRGIKLYVLEVALMRGRITKKSVKHNPVISRTIEIRGDQSLGDLHEAIFDAFDRWDEHLYEFQFGKKPMDPMAKVYGVNPPDFDLKFVMEARYEGEADETRIDSLALRVRSKFFYWFDFGDDWWHKITVKGIQDDVPIDVYPRVSKRVGESPPQYPDQDEGEGYDDDGDKVPEDE